MQKNYWVASNTNPLIEVILKGDICNDNDRGDNGSLEDVLE